MRRVPSRNLRYFLASLLAGLFLVVEPSYTAGIFVLISLLSVSLYQVIMNYKRNRVGFMLMFIFMLSYSVVSINYYIFHDQISLYRSTAESVSTVYYVNLYCYIFYLSISYFVRSSGGAFSDDLNEPPPFVGKFNNNIILGLCIIGTFICMIYGKNGKNIFEAGGYGAAVKEMEVNLLFGYGILFIFVGLFYANTKAKLRLMFAVSAMYIFRDLSFGGRIDSIMLVLALFMLYFRFVLTKKTIITLIIVAFCFLSVWEVFRSIADLSVLGEMSKDGMVRIGLTTGNSSDVYYASMRIIYLIQEGVLNLTNRIESGFYFILATFVPFNHLPPVANLSTFAPQYSTGGGGLAPIFLYAMFGLPGVIALGAWIGISLRRLKRSEFSIYGYFYSVLIVATIPRWYAYYPITITKYCLYGIILLISCRILDNFIKKATNYSK